MENPEPTGDPAVDAVLTTLEGLADRPLSGHVAAFDQVQAALAARLAETDG